MPRHLCFGVPVSMQVILYRLAMPRHELSYWRRLQLTEMGRLSVPSSPHNLAFSIGEMQQMRTTMTRSMISTWMAIPCRILLLLLLLLTSSPTWFPIMAESKFTPKDTVDIVNQMSGAITVHCKSRDNDLGAQILAPGQKYNFRFHRNFWGTTLFWGTFTSPAGRQKTLQVWSATVMKHSRCYGKCFWYVREDGFWVTDYNYRYTPVSEKFMVPW